MPNRRVKAATTCMAVLCAVLMGPVAGASASDASIKRVIKQWNPKILVAEGHAITAIGEYKTTLNAAPVEIALTESIEVLHGLKTKISHQSAVTARVKEGKAKLEKGLAAVITAYGHLKIAFAVHAASPQAATEQAETADLAVKHGRLELAEGLKLLK